MTRPEDTRTEGTQMQEPEVAEPGMKGTLGEAGGRWRLRFERPLAHSAEKVWRAITEPAHLQAWFPQRITGEWVVGGVVTFHGDLVPDFQGEVLAYAPPSLLEFRWGTDVIRLEIEERPGGCTLTLLDTIDEIGKAARDGAGWHECLDLLACHLDGERPAWRPGQRWAQVHPGYVEAFGPGGATIGPPPGYEPA
jgi:uncharacterized protein YndB with AHSA1/START domain